jgi:thiol-disulfide isomerase/thioredoxin
VFALGEPTVHASASPRAAPAPDSVGAIAPSGETRSLPPAPADDPDSGAELIGAPPPPFAFTRWVRGPALTLEQLRGKVVVVRFWTEECRFCRATLPALETVRRRDADRGLVVIGAFHPNEPGSHRTDAHIRRVAGELGFAGPIACDEEWRTLGAWWLDGHPGRNWVSCSFLIGRDGRVRWVHGGGEYHPSSDPRHHRCDVQFAGFEKALAAALAEPAPAAR